MWDSQSVTADNEELSREDGRKLPAKMLLKENRSQAESSLVKASQKRNRRSKTESLCHQLS